MQHYKKTVMGAALAATALSAGVFFAFSVAINPAFSRLSDKSYIEGMQAINKDIQNPWFFSVFFGAMFLLPLASYLYRKSGSFKAANLLAVAAALYIIGTVGVTSAANVPLNDKLRTVTVSALTPSELATARSDYSEPWNAWHTVRTTAAVAALLTATAACVIAIKPTNKTN